MCKNTSQHECKSTKVQARVLHIQKLEVLQLSAIDCNIPMNDIIVFKEIIEFLE